MSKRLNSFEARKILDASKYTIDSNLKKYYGVKCDDCKKENSHRLYVKESKSGYNPFEFVLCCKCLIKRAKQFIKNK
jgi:hypothetical protein